MCSEMHDLGSFQILQRHNRPVSQDGRSVDYVGPVLDPVELEGEILDTADGDAAEEVVQEVGLLDSKDEPVLLLHVEEDLDKGRLQQRKYYH